jgi:hypothetical protein
MKTLQARAKRCQAALEGTVNDIPAGKPFGMKGLAFTPDVGERLRQYMANALSEISVVKRFGTDRVIDPSGAVGTMDRRSFANGKADYYAYCSRFVTRVEYGEHAGSTFTVYAQLTPIPASPALLSTFKGLEVEERIYNRLTPHLRDVLLSCNLSQLQVLEKQLNVTIELQSNPTEIKVQSSDILCPTLQLIVFSRW